MLLHHEGYWLGRILLQRGLSAVYLTAFLAALLQFKPLLGTGGLLPIPKFLEKNSFRQNPSLFYWRYSDRLYALVAGSGAAVAALGLLGLIDAGPLWLSMAAWLYLWAAYQSIVNVGQRFYGFGWESMVLEAGFFAAFLGPTWMQPSFIPILCLRWMLVRVELGAGLIKLRHDKCWRDLTCLYYHYETQPMPNPLSWHFHHMPRWFHRSGVFGSHIVQLVLPFCLLLPQPLASWAAVLTIGHQLWLIVSGNYSWLNWITAVLGASALSDRFLHFTPPVGSPRPLLFDLLLVALALLTVWLSDKPTRNLFSKNQAMNRSYNPLHLVNTYGAFGSVTKERYELIVEGTRDAFYGPETEWREYEFLGKPGDPQRRPPQFAPYHLRLDWLVWFLPLRLGTNLSPRTPGRRLAHQYETWFVRFIDRLLEGNLDMLELMRTNPFPGAPPALIRVLVYRYRYTTPEERRQTGAWWDRQQVGVYLPPYGLPTGIQT